MEKQNLLGDPFIHSKDDIKVFLMIQYHDEVQYAVHKSLLKVKSFFDKSIYDEYLLQLEEYKEKQKMWEENGKVGDNPKEPKQPFEQQAEQWIKDNPIDGQYSAIGYIHKDTPFKGLHYVTLPSPVSEIIINSIDSVVNELNVRVSLSIEWITNTNWRGCH